MFENQKLIESWILGHDKVVVVSVLLENIYQIIQYNEVAPDTDEGYCEYGYKICH